MMICLLFKQMWRWIHVLKMCTFAHGAPNARMWRACFVDQMVLLRWFPEEAQSKHEW